MKYKLAKIEICNKVNHPIVIIIEPWANDYCILPGETFEITALSDKMDINSYFHVVYSENQIDVYPEGQCDDFSVMLNGQELECGHNRPEGYFT
jgi:hypothetical protein